MKRKVKRVVKRGAYTQGLWKKDYKRYWTEDFPEGPQRIYLIGGYRGALNISPFRTSKFRNWLEFATYYTDNKDEFDWDYLDCAYSDPNECDKVGSFYKEVCQIKTPEELLSCIIDVDHLDPMLLVREDCSLLQWMMEIQGLHHCS